MEIIFDFTGRGENNNPAMCHLAPDQDEKNQWGDIWADMPERNWIEDAIREHARKGEKIKVKITRLRT